MVCQVLLSFLRTQTKDNSKIQNEGGGDAWITAAANLRNAGPDGTQIIVMVIDDTITNGDRNAAKAYNDSTLSKDDR